MTTGVRPWLPRGAFTDGVLTELIQALARDWAKAWFGSDRPVATRVRDGAALPSARDTPSWRAGDGLRLSLDVHAPFAWWMLGLSPGAHGLKSRDEALFKKLSAKCARDLLERAQISLLDARAPIAELAVSSHARDDVIWSLSLGAVTNVVHLVATPEVAARARLRTLPAIPARRPLARRADAIARQGVRIGAMVGRARIQLADMRSLARGDVLVLDRGPGNTAELSIEGAAAADTPCLLRQQGDDLTLSLASPSVSE